MYLIIFQDAINRHINKLQDSVGLLSGSVQDVPTKSLQVN